MISDDVFSQLRNKPYLCVPFPIDRSELESAMASFLRFLALPSEVKKHIELKIAPRHRRGDIGYRHREARDDDFRDDKEFFHYHPLILDTYQKFLDDHPVVNDFMMRAHRIWQAVYDVVLAVLKNLDARFLGTSEKVFDSDQPHILLRFLRYDWQKGGMYLARPHFDAGSFTLAIAESGPGLRIGTSPSDLEIITHQDNHAIFMLSSNFRKLIDSTEMNPGWHDVIQLDETQIGKPFARWAIVAFIEGKDVVALPRSETHRFHLNTSLEGVHG